MTAQAKLQSKEIEYTETGLSATYVYIVYDATDHDDAIEACAHTPGSTAETITNPLTYGTAICQSVTAVSVDGADDTVWRVTVKWGTKQSQGAGNGPGQSSDAAEITTDVGGEFIDIWREIPAPSSGDPTGADIGGTKVDRQGQPVSAFCWQTSMQITKRYYGTGNIPWSMIYGNLGKRNSTVFEGASIGQTLFKGVKVSSVDKCVFQVAFEFAGDQFYHCRQVPDRADDGRVKLVSGQAGVVKWYQPFWLTKQNFYDMLGEYDYCAD
jgi:hypothetical protein